MGAYWQRCLGALFLAATVLFTAQAASAETRSLKLHFTHTNERAEIVFKRNGRFVQGGLDQINHLLRDWRRNERAKMDPRVIDLLWHVYRDVGARDYIHIVSAYRSPTTNSMLRSRSSGVAENSQHTLGKAIDFFIPGVPVSRLRAAAFRAEGGGVGFYPNSGSPFVHIDVGNVRSWPRMNRNELMALFPDGRTIHVPSDGKPLPGYQQAMAAYRSRQGQANNVQIASDDNGGNRRRGGLLAAIFGGGADQAEDEGEARVIAQRPTPQRAVASAAPQRPQQAVPQQAPAQAAQPETPATPETVLAALSARDVPLPQLAPRADAPREDVVALALAAIEEPASLPFQVKPAPESEALGETAELLAANVPLPTRRPELAPAVVEREEPVAVASAEQAARVSASGDLLAQLARDPAPQQSPTATLAAYVPVPGERPERTVYEVAALPEARPSLTDRIPSGDDVEYARQSAAERTERLARLPSVPAGSPKATIVSRQSGVDPIAAIDSGVRTTTKSARPTGDVSRAERRARQVPMQEQVARWALSRQPVVDNTEGTQAPSFARDLVRSAPRMVYTAGFQPNGEALQADRFSGKAVHFMSVARFSTN